VSSAIVPRGISGRLTFAHVDVSTITHKLSVAGYGRATKNMVVVQHFLLFEVV
jgi:hypothetical protein